MEVVEQIQLAWPRSVCDTKIRVSSHLNVFSKTHIVCSGSGLPAVSCISSSDRMTSPNTSQILS